MNLLMPILLVSLITGCATQAPYSPPSAQPVKPSEEEVCAETLFTVAAVHKETLPIIQKCIDGDRMNCGAFAILQDRMQLPTLFQNALTCLETGAISPTHPAALAANYRVKEYAKKLQQLNKAMGI